MVLGCDWKMKLGFGGFRPLEIQTQDVNSEDERRS